MVRSACCEKMGLKKGPWSPEEDEILVKFIKQHGHGNWRALPKQAGLLRCGKSCRLRWTNYLRPDIKRGNFTKQEEDTIFSLHHLLGNRWSAIAARLPGRTDNEIKNVWHTHLKKKLIAKNPNPLISPPVSDPDQIRVSSPQPECSSDISSVTDEKKAVPVKKEEFDYSSSEYFPQIDESFWSVTEYAAGCPTLKTEERNDTDAAGGMDFWYNLFIRAGDLPDLPEF